MLPRDVIDIRVNIYKTMIGFMVEQCIVLVKTSYITRVMPHVNSFCIKNITKN
jgi:hypothetical protein